MKLPIVLVPLFAAAALAAQTPAPAQDSAGQNHARAHRNTRLQRLTARFGLTSDQQSKAQAIFKESRAQSRTLAAKLHEQRPALQAAIKADSEQQIDQITQQESALSAQLKAIRLKGMARFYAILTPEQKAKFDARLDHGKRRA